MLALPLQRQACRERELWLCRTVAMGEVERSFRRLLCRMHTAAIAVAVVKGGKQGLTLRGQHAQGVVLFSVAFHLVDAVKVVACVVVALTNGVRRTQVEAVQSHGIVDELTGIECRSLHVEMMVRRLGILVSVILPVLRAEVVDAVHGKTVVGRLAIVKVTIK